MWVGILFALMYWFFSFFQCQLEKERTAFTPEKKSAAKKSLTVCRENINIILNR